VAPEGGAGGDAPLVSIVILTWNSRHMLARSVASVLAQRGAPVELIIVDNASTDGTPGALAQYAGVATIARLPRNLGFARGMNVGYAIARGEFIVPMNADVVLHPDFCAAAVAHFRAHGDVGVIGPYVLRVGEDGDGRFWGWDPPVDLPLDGAVVGLTRVFLRVRSVEEYNDTWRISFKANGCCPVVRRATIEDLRARFGVAPFDPVFDTYGEDVDFAFKTWALRWRTMFARDVIAGHVRSYASPIELRDKRGRLRVNLIAERYINAIRHLPPAQLLSVAGIALLNDLAMIPLQRVKGDTWVAADVGAAFARLWRLRCSLRRFRRQHRNWERINFDTEVYCADSC
jgi:GT2 family glycosyltransferase